MGVPHNLSISVKEALQQSSHIDRLDAEVLLAHILNKNRSFLYGFGDYLLTKNEADVFNQLITQRLEGVPVAYLCGMQEFWSMRFLVNKSVLIPRPDTETLVECALRFIGTNKKPKILELGTGSGAIACALASEIPQAKITATDNNQAALLLAKKNAKILGFESIVFYIGSWFEPVNQLFNLILSNPPYIHAHDAHLEALRFEPRNALVADKGGLGDIQTIVSKGRNYLYEGGALILEHGFEQGADVREIFAKSGFVDIQTEFDLTGCERVTWGKSFKNL